jgi:hypothetical protein
MGTCRTDLVTYQASHWRGIGHFVNVELSYVWWPGTTRIQPSQSHLGRTQQTAAA